MLGVRADITPQVARIDAHLLNEAGVTRLCYAGSVLRTRAAAPRRTREVIQVGAELFGEPGIDGDREVIALLISSLRAAGVARPASRPRPRRRLSRARQRRRPRQQRRRQRRCSTRCAPRTRPRCEALTRAAAGRLARRAARAADALRPRRRGAARARARELPDIARRSPTRSRRSTRSRARPRRASRHCTSISPTCAAIITTTARSSRCSPPASRAAIGNGGRYDGIGKAFGRARPATGFTLDLRQLADVVARG